MIISEIKMFSCKIVLDLLYILVSAGYEIGVVLNISKYLSVDVDGFNQNMKLYLYACF